MIAFHLNEGGCVVVNNCGMQESAMNTKYKHEKTVEVVVARCDNCRKLHQ